MVGKLRAQRLISARRFGGGEKPARASVKPVDNAGAGRLADMRNLRAMREKRVHQRSRLGAGRRMRRHARRFVDDKSVRFFIDDVKGYRFGLRGFGLGRIERAFDSLSSGHTKAGRSALAVDKDCAGAYGALDVAARPAGGGFDNQFIQTHASAFLRHPEDGFIRHGYARRASAFRRGALTRLSHKFNNYPGSACRS